MKFLVAAVGMAALFTLAPAFAKEDPLPDLEKENVQTFQVQADNVHQQMQQGGRFEFIKDDDRAAVEEGLKFMHDLIEQNGTVAAMKPSDKILLINRQGRVNGLLTHADRDRVVCEKTDQPGSYFQVTTCHTVGELARRTRDSRSALQDARRNVTITPSKGN